MRRFLLATALGMLAVSPVAAQQPTKGTWELGGFGRYNWYDKSFNQIDSTKGKNSWGGGGRVGYFFSPKWNIEVDGSANATDVDNANASSVGLVYMPFHLGVNYNARLGDAFSWFIGPRVNYNRYNVSSAGDDFTVKTFEGDDFGFGGITGFRWHMTERWTVRLDGTLDYIPSPQSDTEGSNTMLGLQAGLSVFLGGKCKDRIDSIRVEPKSQEIFVGDQATLKVSGFRCDGQVVDLSSASMARALAAGATLSGMTFTGTTAGCYDIEVSNASAKKGTDTARICVKERPKPVVTLDRCELVPSNATVYPGQTQDYRVVGYYSDGTSRDLPDATLNANGGTVTGRTYRAPAAGNYVITAQCGSGKMATANVTVRSISITLRALFEFDKARVFQQAELDSLRWLADQLKQFPTLALTLYGHTDWVGSVKYNETLGMRRIQAVMDTLASYGVDKARMQAWTNTSYGECQPVADNKTREGRALNRRVEIFDAQSAKQYEGTGSCRNRP
jgi:outer membrane protein OmpA-like peptidoglycan-associated protein/opacity protein-like surface antigen